MREALGRRFGRVVHRETYERLMHRGDGLQAAAVLRAASFGGAALTSTVESGLRTAVWCWVGWVVSLGLVHRRWWRRQPVGQVGLAVVGFALALYASPSVRFGAMLAGCVSLAMLSYCRRSWRPALLLASALAAVAASDRLPGGDAWRVFVTLAWAGPVSVAFGRWVRYRDDLVVAVRVEVAEARRVLAEVSDMVELVEDAKRHVLDACAAVSTILDTGTPAPGLVSACDAVVVEEMFRRDVAAPVGPRAS